MTKANYDLNEVNVYNYALICRKPLIIYPRSTTIYMFYHNFSVFSVFIFSLCQFLCYASLTVWCWYDKLNLLCTAALISLLQEKLELSRWGF